MSNSIEKNQDAENERLHSAINKAITNLIEELAKNKVNLNDFSFYWTYKNDKSDMQGGF